MQKSEKVLTKANMSAEIIP